MTTENIIKTVIHSNGSKWAGQEPDSIEKLIEVLNHNELDLERFACHGFVTWVDNNDGNDYEHSEVKIWGNFRNLSHVFDINGEYKTLEPLIRAIERNIKRQCEKIDNQ